MSPVVLFVSIVHSSELKSEIEKAISNFWLSPPVRASRQLEHDDPDDKERELVKDWKLSSLRARSAVFAQIRQRLGRASADLASLTDQTRETNFIFTEGCYISNPDPSVGKVPLD